MNAAEQWLANLQPIGEREWVVELWNPSPDVLTRTSVPRGHILESMKENFRNKWMPLFWIGDQFEPPSTIDEAIKKATSMRDIHSAEYRLRNIRTGDIIMADIL